MFLVVNMDDPLVLDENRHHETSSLREVVEVNQENLKFLIHYPLAIIILKGL